MPCDDNVCGTGGWSGPLPGDPDNSSVLTATPDYGGIKVAWTYPVINPHAVIHTWLYRGITPLFELAVRQQIVAGSAYFDRIPKAEIQPYYYWIVIISVNGTPGEPIGPAVAVPMATIAETIQDLTGLIDAGVLSESLRTEIERIEILNQHIIQETDDRIIDINTITAALSDTQADGAETLALMQQEVTLRIGANEALASLINTAQVSLGADIATVQTNLQATIDEVGDIGALYTAKVDVNGLVGGFGVHNTGTTVEAGFDVDRFWVGRTTNKIKPFIIDNGVVYIDSAAINKLSADKIDADSLSAISATIGVLRTASSGPRLEIHDNVIMVFDGISETPRVKIGDLS